MKTYGEVEVRDLLRVQAALPPVGKSPQCPLDRRLCGPLSWSGLCGEEKNILHHAGSRTIAVEAVARNHTDWAVPAYRNSAYNTKCLQAAPCQKSLVYIHFDARIIGRISLSRNYFLGNITSWSFIAGALSCVQVRTTFIRFSQMVFSPSYLFLTLFIYLSFSCVPSEPGWRCRYSDWLRAGRPRGRSSSPGMVKNFHFTSSRPALGSTQPPIQWVPGALSRE
jgi:hypothetical protein